MKIGKLPGKSLAETGETAAVRGRDPTGNPEVAAEIDHRRERRPGKAARRESGGDPPLAGEVGRRERPLAPRDP